MATSQLKPKASKSSLVSHTFPPFYACYLLKSIKSARSTATYIGSTPHPPRRIRQHNGEITQGAWKTSRNRPWVMNMIVHGFPSKLAALQFEWAWQHPNLSRHLKGEDMTKGRTLKANIAVVRSMLTTHPYITWPLHVKLFTPDAVKGWTEACKNQTLLPPGFTSSVELEGVDGKHEDVGSGRKGPIDVTDKAFTSEHLAKHMAVLSTGEPQMCTICGSDLDVHKANPLSLALCTKPNCAAYSHLTCLAASFLDTTTSLPKLSMIPRGGTCRNCNKYVLWGDIVRGCYRRRSDREGATSEQFNTVEEAEQEDCDGLEHVFESEFEEPQQDFVRKDKSRSVKPPSKASPKGKKKRLLNAPEEEGEFFHLDAVSGSDSATSPSSSTRPPPPVTKTVNPPPPPSPRPRGRPRGSKSKSKSTSAPAAKISDEFFVIGDFPSTHGLGDKDLPRTHKPSSTPLDQSGVGLADALASIHISPSSDIYGFRVGPSSSPRRGIRSYSRKRDPRTDIDEDSVIEISD